MPHSSTKHSNDQVQEKREIDRLSVFVGKARDINYIELIAVPDALKQ